MKFPRPRSLNGLILVGFGLVALPLLGAVIWALFNLDRLAEQSEQLVITGVSAAENNRLLAQQVDSLERVARQYIVLRDDDTLALLQQDLVSLEATLDNMAALTEQAQAVSLARAIRVTARRIARVLSDSKPIDSGATIADFVTLRERVSRLSQELNSHIAMQLAEIEERTQRAQQISAWQTAALAPGTLVLIVLFTILVARPIRQIDRAIAQLGRGGFSKPIDVKGPTDLERLGRQLEWLRLRLLELAQEKNRFLRHMSHELKTPLANIREGTELLLDGAVGNLDQSQREVTDILRSNGLKLQQLIENLLSFSAWQTQNEDLSVTEFPLRALVIAAAKEQHLALTTAQIHLDLDVEDIVVHADRDKIRTVLDNLLSNAVKFTPKDGTITIRAKREAASFVLEFADSGPGIPEHEAPRIFEAFFQGQQQQGGFVAGTGIGLSVVLECVQAHDGSVELVNTDEFTGAHFRIRIPQEKQATKPRIAANA
ncbi:MAG: ATP-binding protein [Woeseiaceae bacterium]|nr:ATP-binding protein [Woeseiaceae bacterium]